MKPVVSIIVPVYKVEKYIKRCIESIVKQTYENLEIILVDDESPDSCPEICDSWCKKDLRIKVIHKQNGGLSDARNAGLSIATGEYVLFVDSDDWISNNMVENMLKTMIDDGTDMVICQYNTVFKDGSIEPKNKRYDKQILTQKESLKLLLEHQQITNHVWRKMYKRELIPLNIFPVGMVYEDIYVVADLIMKCKNISYVDDAYYNYFQNDSGISKNMSFKTGKNLYAVNKHRNNVILKKYPELKKAVRKSMIETKRNICKGCLVSILKKNTFLYKNAYKLRSFLKK